MTEGARTTAAMTAVIAVAASLAAPANPPPSDREVANVAAFARMYGVVRYFYPSDTAAAIDWDRLAVVGAGRARRAPDPGRLREALEALFQPLGPGIEVGVTLSRATEAPADGPLVSWRYLGPGFSGGAYAGKRTHRGAGDELFTESPPSPGAHVEVDLGYGLKARVPLVLTDAEARRSDTRREGLEALRRALASGSSPSEDLDLDTRLADVVVAWNVFRHFYPYWPETGVRWDDRLQPNLRAARAAETRAAHADALRVLVSEARDGHGGVSDPLSRESRGTLPVALRVVEGRLAITASSAAEAPVGAIVAAVDGAPAQQWLADRVRLVSGTAQWREARALLAFATGPRGADVRFTVDDGSGPRDVTLRYEGEQPPLEKRPDPIVELAPGMWYVDLTRTTAGQLTPRLETLAAARGLVFDVRGYPTDAGAMILPHLIEEPEMDRWMHVAKLVGPFSQSAGWLDLGWYLRPAAPRLAGRRVFMTDGRAISYAESVMAYVADLRLATIVGGNTAGTNGDVASFAVPSGLRIRFSGLRVTHHDGHTPFHLVGVKPDVPVAPTIAGLRRGRDEVLERAIAAIDAPR